MITVIDAPCGYGKTTYVINYMNEHPEMKFIYVTPYLDECERILQAVPNMVTPEAVKGGKSRDFSNAVLLGRSIVTTHSLFTECHKQIVPFLDKYNYNLILDEVLNVVEVIDTRKNDIDTLIASGCIEIEEDGKINWIKELIDNRYNDIKYYCIFHDVYYVNKSVVVWVFPVSIFKAFKNIFICTYMFDCQIQRYYYDFFGLTYTMVGVLNGKLIPYYFIPPALDKINVTENLTLNRIGEKEHSLSKTWYSKRKKSELQKIGNNIYNFFHNICKVKVDSTLWTTFKEFKHSSYVNGYWGGFVPSNIRATNQYKDRYCIAYPINKYVHPSIKQFFQLKDIFMDDDSYALSEMIQFIYRGAIRDGKDVYVYIPSLRMRRLLSTLS